MRIQKPPAQAQTQWRHKCPVCDKLTYGLGHPGRVYSPCCSVQCLNLDFEHKVASPPTFKPMPLCVLCHHPFTPNLQPDICDVCEANRLAWIRQMQYSQHRARSMWRTFSSFFEEAYVVCYACPTCGDAVSEGYGEIPPTCCVHCGPTQWKSFSVKESDYMTPVTNVRVWWDPTILAYRVASPYNKELVDTLKKHIPYSDRSFDEVSKTWIIVERQLTPLQGLFKLLGITPSVLTRQQVDAASQQSSSAQAQRGKPLDAIALEFMRLVPPLAMQKAYRLAAMELHPDRQGGDGSRMASLNAAWERLQKEVYKIGVDNG